jgi:hypothetical protein
MYCEMICSCEATLHVESENDDGIWMMALRFANAHSKCGYMTPNAEANDEQKTRRKIIKPDLTSDVIGDDE